jgi:hypothetical protein
LALLLQLQAARRDIELTTAKIAQVNANFESTIQAHNLAVQVNTRNIRI